MSLTSRLKQRIPFFILIALISSFTLSTGNSQQSTLEYAAENTKGESDSSSLFGSEAAKSIPPSLSWREIQVTRTSKVVRVRFQIKEIATSVDDQLMQITPSKWGAIVLSPEQDRETKSNQRFEVAIVGKARTKVAHLGLSSEYFKDKWIEITGVCRHYKESWAHGTVIVSQFLVNDLNMIEVNGSN